MSLVLRWLATFFSGWVVILIGTTFSTEVAAADTYRICAHGYVIIGAFFLAVAVFLYLLIQALSATSTTIELLGNSDQSA